MYDALVPGVLYARQSLTTAGSESLPEQLDRMREAAPRFGVEVVAEIIEPPSTSAFKNRGRSRPEFPRLLDMLRNGDAKVIMVYKSDRLSRGGGPGWAPVFDAAEEGGLNLDHFVATPHGFMTEFEIGIRATMDREESKKNQERMTDMRAREAKAGKPRPGRYRRFGYEADCLTVIPHERDLILEAAERVLTGQTPHSIVKDWNERRVATVTGEPWRIPTLLKVLRNPHNAGLREHNGIVIGPGLQAPLYDEDMHHVLVAALQPRRKIGRSVRVTPLTGIAVCGKKGCGQRLRSIRRTDGTRAMQCRSGPGEAGCGGVSIVTHQLEAAIRDRVFALLLDKKIRAQMDKTPKANRTDSIAVQIRKVEKRLRRLLDLYEDEGISMAEYKRRKQEHQQELSTLETQITTASNPVHGLPVTYDELLAVWNENDVCWQKAIIQLFFDRIPILPVGPGGRGFDPSRIAWPRPLV